MVFRVFASNGRCPRLSCRDVETCTGDAPKTWPIRWRLILSAIRHNSPTALGAGFACQVRAACERVTPPALGRFNHVKREFYVFHRSPLKPRQPVRWNASGRVCHRVGRVDRCQQAVQAGKQ